MSNPRHLRFIALSLTTALLATAQAQVSAPAQTKTPIQTKAPALAETTQPEPEVVTETSANSPQTERVTLPFRLETSNLPERATTLLLAQPLPEGTTYAFGSSALDAGTAAEITLPEPLQGTDGTLYWRLPVQDTGRLSFKLTGAGAADLPQAALAWLDEVGAPYAISGKLNARDYLSIVTPAAQEANPPHILQPPAGTVYRNTDQATLLVEGPLEETLSVLVNGAPVAQERLGTITEDTTNGVQRLEYFGVQLQTGRNVVQLRSPSINEEMTLFVAGAVEQVTVEPLQLQADGSTPLRLRLRATDTEGQGTAASYLTVNSNLEPLGPDAEPTVAGYQVALRQGVGVLELQPQTLPEPLELELISGERHWNERLEVSAGERELGVGVLSATLGFGGGEGANLSWQGRASYEGPVADGQLYVSADKDGLPRTPGVRENNERFPVYGDQSVETVPLRASGPIAAAFEHPDFRAAYRHDALDSQVLPLGQSVTALTASSKSNPEYSGFVAALPATAITDQRIVPDGTRLLKLGHTDIAQNTLGLVLVTTDPLTGTELRRRNLQEGAEWVLDPESGVVTLTRALDPVNSELNEQHILASYRLQNGEAGTEWAYGAQVVQRGKLDVAGDAGEYRVGAGAAQIGGAATFGVRAGFAGNLYQADSRVLYSGGLLTTLEATAKPRLTGALGPDGAEGSAHLRYQSEGYEGLSAGESGLDARAHYRQPITPLLGAEVNAEYLTRADGKRGYAEALGLYKQAPWTFGAGARYSFGDTGGLGVTGSVEYNLLPLNARLKHSQPFTGDVNAQTELKASYAIAENVTLSAKDRVTWGDGAEHLATIALTSRAGNADYIAAYETGGDGGQASRARLGVGTTWPLNERTTLGAKASYVRDFVAAENIYTLSSDLGYRGDEYRATAGADLTSKGGEFGTVLRAGVVGELTPQLSASADATAEFGERGEGVKLGVGYAYRAAPLSSLGYLRYATGSLAKENKLSAGVAAAYSANPFKVRAGVDARMLMDFDDSLTLQPYAGVNYYPAERFMVGAWGRALLQPANDFARYGYGLEGGYEVLDNFWLTAGYNLKGFDSITTDGLHTRQGFYVRADLALDDTLNDRSKQ